MTDPRDEPPGNGRPADAFAAEQRRRLIDAVALCMARYGYAELTIAQIAAAAGVSRSTFYENFANKLEAVLVAHEAVFEPFFDSISQVCGLPREWPVRVTTAIGAALDYARNQPHHAQLLTVEAITQNAEVARRVLDSTDRLAELLSGGRRFTPGASELPALTEKAVVGGISAIVYRRLVDGEPERLPELKRELAEITLLPFLGPQLAARIAAEQA
jgi:AcrR family transcriptional regulator